MTVFSLTRYAREDRNIDLMPLNSYEVIWPAKGDEQRDYEMRRSLVFSRERTKPLLVLESQLVESLGEKTQSLQWLWERKAVSGDRNNCRRKVSQLARQIQRCAFKRGDNGGPASGTQTTYATAWQHRAVEVVGNLY